MAVMILFVLGALLVPIVAMLIFAQDFLATVRNAPEPATETVETFDPGLRDTLERAAAALGDDELRLVDDDELIVLNLPESEIATRHRHLLREAEKAGGFAMEMPGDPQDTLRLMVTIPVGNHSLFLESVRGLAIDYSGAPGGGESSLVDVRLRLEQSPVASPE